MNLFYQEYKKIQNTKPITIELPQVQQVQQMQIISLEVSLFNYDDYCNLFETYNNDDENIELRTIIDRLGFNIDRPNAIISKANGDVIAAIITNANDDVIATTTASDQAEIDTYMKDAKYVMKLGLWTVFKFSRDYFESEMTRLFNHSCKIIYQIKNHHTSEIITILRIYTMSSRLNTVQMVEFILETDENSNTNRWIYFDITKSNRNTLILNKYRLACNTIYDFYIEKDFEEIDDEQMWEHELFQTGLHTLEY